MTVEQQASATLRADLVLEGGGVKGIALVGAVQALSEAGYRFERVAGTSAGAIVGAVIAALRQRGESMSRLEEIARSLDYTKFADRGFLGRHLGPLGFLTDGLSMLFEVGAYEGHYLERWLTGVLEDLGVRTFGDLRIEDSGDDGQLHSRYRLVVNASDVSRKALAQFPWDYPRYGLDPDEQVVAHAVRASASIPYFFEPVTLKGTQGTSTLVDGALVSNYPIDTFDRADGTQPRWPTIGVRLDSLAQDQAQPADPIKDPISMGIALVETAIEGCQAEHVLEKCNVARSVQVDTSGVDAIDFGITRAQQDELLRNGRAAAGTFLATWDFDQWVRDCRGAS